ALAGKLGWSDDDRAAVSQAARLHDVGKLGLPDTLLGARGADLDERERAELSRHPLIGARLVEGIDLPAGTLEIIRQHHERVDGTGYPQSLPGEQIVAGARLLAVADVYDTIRSHRSYCDAMPYDEAAAELRR